MSGTLGFIIWIIGLVLAIKAALEIWGTSGNALKKIILIVLVLITSWIGLLVYYLLLRGKVGKIVK